MRKESSPPPSHPDKEHATPAAGATAVNDCWNKIGIWGDSSCPELTAFSHCRNCPVYSAAGVQMLDRELAPGYRQEWTDLLARPKPARITGTKSVAIFRIGAEWLSLPAQVLQEVAERRVPHTLPHRDSNMLLGLVNIRGELLVCVSLSRLLGVEAAPAKTKEAPHSVYERLLVAMRDGQRLVFPVSEVYGIHRYHPSELKAVPATVSLAAAKYSHGVLLWHDKTVGCLDDELIFYTLNRSLT